MQGGEWKEFCCRFLSKGEQCSARNINNSWFCDIHQKNYDGISNQDLLERHTTAFANCIIVKDKVIHMREINEKDGSWDDVYNLWHELTNRGYRDTDIQECNGNILEQRNFFSGLMKQLRGEKQWRKFEKLVAGIHLSGGRETKVKFDDTIVDKRTGRPRQIDVSIRHKQDFYEHLTIIECKDRSRKVTVEWIEGFRSKIEDVGAQKGVMVSPIGFTEGALQKAKSYGIDLFTLMPQLNGWVKRKKQHVEEVAFPDGFHFDCPPIADYLPVSNPSLDEILIRCHSDGSVKSLADFTVDICERITVKKVALPAEVKINFVQENERTYAIRFPGHHSFIPLFGMTIQMKSHKRDIGYTVIDIPPKVIGYTYKNVLTGQKHKIRVEDIPKGVGTVLKPGEYYKDKFNLKWRCISIDSSEAVMWLMDFPLQSCTICVEDRKSLDEAYNFVPMDDELEQKRLEEIYQLKLTEDKL